VKRNHKAGQNPPRVVAPIEEEEVCGMWYCRALDNCAPTLNSLKNGVRINQI